ncbi:MAG: glycerol-3-phosphate 1-O-acyltransferase PlsY [Clostridia bacterium]|nr:glycerol-3-phosphate 1-O-acyltransferase PlsY [Clostridia bacterium]
MILGLKLVLVAIVGYLLGSANTSLIVGKFYGTDVRQHGSGNAGMTNTLRTLGKTAALLVIFGDIFKGILSYLIGYYFVGDVKDIGYLGAMVGGVAAIVGHNWPVYFGFKGGKGILTTFSVVLMMDWKIGLGLFVIFAIIVGITRYVSLGSIMAAVLFPVGTAILKVIFDYGKSVVFIAFAAAVAILAVERHKSNIERLLKGTESKLGEKKKDK